MKKNSVPKIFIVEDEPFFANLINRDLESSAYTDTHMFLNGEECIQNLDKKPDFIILDHKLPGMSGLDVLKKIKAFDKKIHVIFLSGAEGLDVQLAAFKLGAEDFIVKDEKSLDELKLLIDEILHRKNK